MHPADIDRKIRALRALAERPGTPHEGDTARIMLAKLLAIRGEWAPPPPLKFERVTCVCGQSYTVFWGSTKCPATKRHGWVRRQKEERFERGDMVELDGRIGRVRTVSSAKFNELKIKWSGTRGRGEFVPVFSRGAWANIDNHSARQRAMAAAYYTGQDEATQYDYYGYF